MKKTTVEKGEYFALAARACDAIERIIEEFRAIEPTSDSERRIHFEVTAAGTLLYNAGTEARQALNMSGLIDHPAIAAIVNGKRKRVADYFTEPSVSPCADCAHLEREGKRYGCKYRKRRYEEHPCKPGCKCWHHAKQAYNTKKETK